MGRRERALERWEKAKEEGEADDKIKDLVEFFNSRKDYYTTSSCSGRIVVCHTKDDDKQFFKFLGKWHRQVSTDEVINSITPVDEGVLWFKMEPFIIHICAKNTGKASNVVREAKKLGLKSSGIFQIRKRVMFQLIGEEWLSTPIGDDGGFLMDESMLDIIVEEANQKISKNFDRMEHLTENLRAKM